MPAEATRVGQRSSVLMASSFRHGAPLILRPKVPFFAAPTAAYRAGAFRVDA